MAHGWREVADGVLVRRHAWLDVNVGLVVGDGACLVVDTRDSVAEGRELLAAVRAVTPAPWSVVTTHAHFDHCFGTAAFVPTPVWAHERCARALADGGAADRERVADAYDQDGRHEQAQQVRDSELVVPERLVREQVVLDVGGRRVELRHLGRGHTDHDLVVVVGDGAGDDEVVLAGDLVEQGAPPQFGDAFPLDWPATLDRLLVATSAPVVVPGHGDVVDRAYTADQRDLLALLVRRSTEGRSAGADVREVAAGLPELGTFAVSAVQRAYWQLDLDAGAAGG